MPKVSVKAFQRRIAELDAQYTVPQPKRPGRILRRSLALLILAIIFVLGWPLEWVPIVLIVVPILMPLVQKLGIDLVWFCTLVAVCLQTAWLSPPVALSAYFLKGVVPDWELKDIYAGMMQFMVLQIIGLLLILYFPQIALWLPALLRE